MSPPKCWTSQLVFGPDMRCTIHAWCNSSLCVSLTRYIRHGLSGLPLSCGVLPITVRCGRQHESQKRQFHNRLFLSVAVGIVRLRFVGRIRRDREAGHTSRRGRHIVGIPGAIALVVTLDAIDPHRVGGINIFPVRFTVGFHNCCGSSNESNVIVTALCTTVMLVMALFIAASVTVNVTMLVPLLNGRFCTQNLPLRSTNPLTVLVFPLLSVIVAATVTVASATCPSMVKPPPLTSVPFCGHVICTVGGFVLPE